MEHERTKNLPLAEQHLRLALDMDPSDHLLLNELGVVFYRNNALDDAARCFESALSQPELADHERETAHLNYGHTLRRLGQLAAAQEHYEAALALNPRSAPTLAALGFLHQLRGDLAPAIELYHQALGLRPDYAFADDMLTRALAEAHSVVGHALHPPLAAALAPGARSALRRPPTVPEPQAAAAAAAAPALRTVAATPPVRAPAGGRAAFLNRAALFAGFSSQSPAAGAALPSTGPRTPVGRGLARAPATPAGTVAHSGAPLVASPNITDVSMDMSMEQSPD